MTRTQRQIEEHRQGEACIAVRDRAGRPCAGVPVWVEQETHALVFGCVAPDLAGLPEPDCQRCTARFTEVFNRSLVGGQPAVPEATLVVVPDDVRLGWLRPELDRLAARQPLELHVRGHCAGLSIGKSDAQERAAAERVAALYTLGFAHPAVHAIVWNGFWDGEECADGGGLLRLDFAPKQAFRFLQKLIGIVWHTRASGTTDRDGRFQFRGFFGDYRIAARIGEEVTTDLFSFRGEPGEWAFILQIPAEIAPGCNGRTADQSTPLW